VGPQHIKIDLEDMWNQVPDMDLSCDDRWFWSDFFPKLSALVVKNDSVDDLEKFLRLFVSERRFMTDDEMMSVANLICNRFIAVA